MDINNISNHINNKVNASEPSDGKSSSSGTLSKSSDNSVSDQVSIGRYSENKGEELFAKIEMEKLNQASFDKLKTMKSKISEYQAAKEISNDAAEQTEIGKLLNNPDVWGEIANKIIE